MITTVTLNAAIDKTYCMEQELVGGTVMRVKKVRNTAGGKGLNVARVIKLCGEDVFATGIVGGFNGQYLQSLLDKDGIDHSFLRVESETRSCINILDSRFGSTEFLEPGFEVSSKEEADFLKHFQTLISKSDMITISGSVPRGISRGIYATMIKMVKAAGKRVILDTSGDLLSQALSAQPTVIKPNRDELEALFDAQIRNVSDAAFYADRLSKSGIPYVLISLGEDGALLACKDGIFHGFSPDVEIVNTVGCGDSMVGAFAVALCRNRLPSDALRFAVAVATANAMSEKTGSFDPTVRDFLLDKVTVEKI